MSDHNRRLNKLEDAADEQAPVLPYLILSQDLDDEDLYHGPAGEGHDYRTAQLPELEKHYQLIVIDHARDWLGESDK